MLFVLFHQKMEADTPPYKAIKTSLASIVRSPLVQQRLQDVALLVSKITERASLFLKLYLLSHQHKALPDMVELVDTILKVVSTKVDNRGAKATTTADLKAELTAFYQKHFSPLLPLNDPLLP